MMTPNASRIDTMKYRTPNAAPFALRDIIAPAAVADRHDARRHADIAERVAAVVDIDTPRPSIVIPLPAVALLRARGAGDAYGAFLQSAVAAAVAVQYPDSVIVAGVGAFGGRSAFAALAHRSLADNVRRYRIAPPPPAFACSVCNGTRADICHGVPRAMAGNLTPHNLTVGCADCNRRARDILPLDIIATLYAYTVTLDIGAAAVRAYTDATR